MPTRSKEQHPLLSGHIWQYRLLSDDADGVCRSPQARPFDCDGSARVFRVAAGDPSERSRDELPCALVLVDDDTQVVHAHALVTPVTIQQGHAHTRAALIESVVVRGEDRGKGFGSQIMKAAEDVLLGLGIETIILCTKDRQSFYKRLGYVVCNPPSFAKQVDVLANRDVSSLSAHHDTITSALAVDTSANGDASVIVESPTAPPPPLPPPPPPPPAQTLPPKTLSSSDSQTWFVKLN